MITKKSNVVSTSGPTNRRSLLGKLPHLHIPLTGRRDTLGQTFFSIHLPWSKSKNASTLDGANASLTNGVIADDAGSTAPFLPAPSLLSHCSFHFGWNSDVAESRAPAAMGPYAGTSSAPTHLRVGVLPNPDTDDISIIELPPSAYTQKLSRMALGQNGAVTFAQSVATRASLPEFYTGSGDYSSAMARRYSRRFSVDEYYLDMSLRSPSPSSYGSTLFVEHAENVGSSSSSEEAVDVDYGRWKPMDVKEKNKKRQQLAALFSKFSWSNALKFTHRRANSLVSPTGKSSASDEFDSSELDPLIGNGTGGIVPMAGCTSSWTRPIRRAITFATMTHDPRDAGIGSSRARQEDTSDSDSTDSSWVTTFCHSEDDNDHDSECQRISAEHPPLDSFIKAAGYEKMIPSARKRKPGLSGYANVELYHKSGNEPFKRCN